MALGRYRPFVFAACILAILLILHAISHWSYLPSPIHSWSIGTTSPRLSFSPSTSHPPAMAPPSSSTTYPEPFIHPPTGPHTSTLILLHGTSQDGPLFGEAFLSSALPAHNSSGIRTQILPHLFPNTRFVFPTGRHRYCTVLGRESHAWFDFLSFTDRTLNESLNIEGLAESSRFLGGLVEEEVRILERSKVEIGDETEGISKAGEGSGRIVIGGFSQGAAMAAVGMLSGVLGGIGGFVGMSGWLPFRAQILAAVQAVPEGGLEDAGARVEAAIKHIRQLLSLPALEAGGERSGAGDGVKEAAERLRDVKAWIAHGEYDVKMQPEWGRDMAGLLGEISMNVDLRVYEGLGHWWSEKEIGDLIGFLRGLWNDKTNVNRVVETT